MTTTARQNNLILNEDWTRIYQTFKNADFKSYDFENLRRVIITYLRENYPEDFNDYIESSEYLALIDAVAFLGQSLAFRIDLASRENFIELAERKESVLRLAKMLSYNAKRNVPGQGLLKFTSITTTENLIDSNGKNLANQIVTWNDPTNSNWLEQFIIILNTAMSENTEFGRSQGNGTIQGIPTEQYRFRTTSTDVPIYTFNKTVSGRGMAFEIVSTSFIGANSIYEEAPTPGNQLGFVYRNDGAGPGSPNTGFFLMFKQGSLELADFTIDVPTSNERVSVDAANINNNDVWLFGLNSAGAQQTLWTQVSSLVGNNIVYNSLSRNIRNVYAVETKEEDRIDLIFADGIYGNLPQGSFRTFYRVSNGLTYSISPNEMRGINISVPYLNKQGVPHTLTVGMALQTTVATAAASEDIDSVRQNAPAQYYTQNRMITGEDYNLAPLTSSQNILKIKSINRVSSGISRNFEIIDASGKYSSINVFADDGYIYKQEQETNLTFKYQNRIDIFNTIRNDIEPLFSETNVYNFYLTKFDNILFTDTNYVWQQVTTDVNATTGYFKNVVDNSLLKTGSYSTNNLKYVVYGAMIKFVPPESTDATKKYVFSKGKLLLVGINEQNSSYSDRIWTKVVNVVTDGTANGTGVLSSKKGPVTFSDAVPTGAVAKRIIPKFVTDLPAALETEMINQIYQNLNFGLRYDYTTGSWKIITAANIDLVNDFNLAKAGDTTNNSLDTSWMISFTREPNQYVVRVRGLDYVFGSVEQNRFYYDVNEKQYNDRVGTVIKDQVKILGINTNSDNTSTLNQDIPFEVNSTIRYDDGYESVDRIEVAFRDSDDDNVIDNPEAFIQIVGEDTELNFLFFEKVSDVNGGVDYVLIDNSSDFIIVRQSENTIEEADYSTWANGQLVYFYDSDEDRVKQWNSSTLALTLQTQYFGLHGRRNLKFQYIHNASVDRRIDPSVSNIIDVYLLTRSYDSAYRIWLAGGAEVEPIAPDSDSLAVSFGGKLNAIKSISDEIIYHPVRYKVLFGSKADAKLQAKFKVVKNPTRTISDNDLKVRIITAVNEFFDVNNWDFGDRFYISEMTTYVLNRVAPDVSNLVIVPVQSNQVFGSLFEIQSDPDEIFVSGATVDDIEIVSAITAVEVRASIDSVVTTT